MVGIKRPAEAWPAHLVCGVGERSRSREGPVETLAWSGGEGGCRDEYREIQMKTLGTQNPRVPAPWQSAQGEADPKARPQRRSRWTAGQDSGPVSSPLNPRGPGERRAGGHVDGRLTG